MQENYIFYNTTSRNYLCHPRGHVGGPKSTHFYYFDAFFLDNFFISERLELKEVPFFAELYFVMTIIKTYFYIAPGVMWGSQKAPIYDIFAISQIWGQF